MSNIEEDYNLFQLVKRNPINSCIDLSKNMIGKKRGVFYFTERFRIDFENKMSDFERLKAEREQDKKRIEELEEKNKHLKYVYDDCCKCLLDTIEKQKVKDKIEEYKTRFEKSNLKAENKRYFNERGIYYLLNKIEKSLLEEK